MGQVYDELIQSTLNPIFEPNADLGFKLAVSLGVVIVIWLLRLLVLRLIYRRVQNVTARYWWKKGTTYTAVILGAAAIGPLWLGGLSSVATFLGLVAAGLAIALQSPITDVAGWGFILWRRPFEVGDRIQVGQHTGDVVDIRVFQFSLLEIGNWVDADQSTGRILHVPNKTIFNEVVSNFSQGFRYIWDEIAVLVTFESNWAKAKTILQNIVHRHAAGLSPDVEEQFRKATRRFVIEYTSMLEPAVYTRVEASGVLLTMRYLCEYDKRRLSEHQIWEDILQAFAQEPEIEFAYPTQRFYDDWLERGQKLPKKDG